MASRIMMTASGKGGTGKSTVSVFLASRLAARGKRVLLIELDSGLRSIDYIAGVSGKTVYDIGDVLAGRCGAAKAIVESPLQRGLFVISAPYTGGQIYIEPLKEFLQKAQTIFDEIILDTAAGLGEPFQAACQVSSIALIVITPDPIAMRDGRIVCDELYAKGVQQVRLVINKVPNTLEVCGIDDLDECIDTVGARLLGVVPQSAAIARASATGEGLPPPQIEPAHAIFQAMAARLYGEMVPLLFD